MNSRKFKLKDLKVDQLKSLCRWKKQKGDDPLPTRKADLLSRYKKTKNNQSPHVSPSNSNVEDEDDDVDDAASFDSDATPPENDDLEFGGDDDEEEEEDEEDDDEEEVDEDEEDDEEYGSDEGYTHLGI